MVKGRDSISFYTLPEYDNWKEARGGSVRGWKIKYYKGLGTSTSAEAKEYFAAIDSHRKEFVWEGEGGAGGRQQRRRRAGDHMEESSSCRGVPSCRPGRHATRALIMV